MVFVPKDIGRRLVEQRLSAGRDHDSPFASMDDEFWKNARLSEAETTRRKTAIRARLQSYKAGTLTLEKLLREAVEILAPLKWPGDRARLLGFLAQEALQHSPPKRKKGRAELGRDPFNKTIAEMVQIAVEREGLQVNSASGDVYGAAFERVSKILIGLGIKRTPSQVQRVFYAVRDKSK